MKAVWLTELTNIKFISYDDIPSYPFLFNTIFLVPSFFLHLVFVDHTERALERITSDFIEVTQLLGLEVSLKKTEGLHKFAPWEEYCSPYHHWWDWVEGSPSIHLPVPSHQMPRTTRKLKTGWQRWALHLTDCINVHSTTNTWRKAQRSACIEPSSLPPSNMAYNCGSLISTSYGFCTVAPAVPPNYPTYLGHQYWSLWKCEDHQHWGYAELNTCSRWGIIICLGLYCAASSPLAIMTEGHQRSDSKTARKNPLVPVTINYHWWSTLGENYENCDTWHLTTIHVVSSYENTHWVSLNHKRHSKMNHNIMLWSLDQTFSCSHCDHTALFYISLSATTNVPTGDMNWPLLDFCFMKTSHDRLVWIH